MFTIDASVYVNAANVAEAGSPVSRGLLDRIGDLQTPVFSPTLLLVEVAGALARATDDAAEGVAAARKLRTMPDHTRAVLDDLLAEEAVQLATQCRLRGADAVYGAVAKRHGCKLVTRDQQQLDRLKGAVTCLTPEEALAQLDAATAAS